MKKIFSVVSLMIISIILMAMNQKINIDAHEIELKFENVKIRNIEFYSGKDIEIDYQDLSVTIEKTDNLISVSSDNNSKINIKLPEEKKYKLLQDGNICRFDKDQIEFTGDDGELVTIRDGRLFVKDEEENLLVEVGEDGVIVNDDGEHIEISDQGIIVEGEDNTRLTGFWGQLLGGFVRMVAKTSINYVGKSPEKVVKFLVNDDDDNFSSDWGEEILDHAEKEICESFKPMKGDKLDVSNLNGNIIVKGWDKKEVEILANLKSRRGEDEFNLVQIVVERKKNWQISTKHLKPNPKISVSYIINVPYELSLQLIETTNGSIELTDVSGDISLRSSNGSLEISNVEGSIEAFTSNGRIEVENVNGKVNVTTSNGSISAENVPNLKNCITSNAGITAKVQAIEKDILLSTSNARINLYLNPNIGAEISAATSNANVNVKDISLISKLVSKSKFEGSLGKGGRKITISTSNGSINIYGLD